MLIRNPEEMFNMVIKFVIYGKRTLFQTTISFIPSFYYYKLVNAK